MGDYDTPLATRKSRDSLVRKPLSRLAKTPKPGKYQEQEEDEYDDDERMSTQILLRVHYNGA